MPSDELHQPHDRFSRHIFARRETAAAFLQGYLPPSLARAIDWNSIELQPGSYVDQRLRHQQSDLLFTAAFKDQSSLFLYCLLEHQSKIEWWMPLRLMSYMVQIWQAALKTNPKMTHLPPIIPLVLYQGSKKWNAPVRFLDLLAMPGEIAEELARYQPAFAHVLVDLSQQKAEELKGDVIGRLGLGLMKAVAEQDVIPWLERSWPLLGELLQSDGAPAIVETLLRYLMAADSSVSFETVRQALERAEVQETRDRIMSIAEELIEKGRQEGRQEGRQQGRQEGRQEGEQAGALIGQVQLLQEMLRIPLSSMEELRRKSSEELMLLVQHLRSRLPSN